MGLIKKEFEDLNTKIEQLGQDIDLACSMIAIHREKQWEAIFELMKEIKEDFAKVRYPNKAERDRAWQVFFDLRQDAHEKRQSQFQYKSREHHDELLNMLGGLDYWPLRDGLEIAFVKSLREMKDEMTERGQKVTEAGRHFKSVKHEMIGEHKAEIHNKIIEIRESHEIFWDHYKVKKAELTELWEERQRVKEQRKRDFEERQERKELAKRNLELNIENNKERLEKAENALSKMQSHREELQDKLDSAYNDNFRERCEGWIDELDTKIDDVENQIKRLERWIEEGEDRLRNWE